MTGFNDLPLELRSLIWEYSLPGPRNVSVDIQRHTRAPVIFHICQESRAEAQRIGHYELAFPVPTTDLKVNKGRVIWFNFSHDRLCVDKFLLWLVICPESSQPLRSLGLMCVRPLICWEILSHIGNWRKALSGLEEVVLIRKDDNDADHAKLVDTASVPAPVDTYRRCPLIKPYWTIPMRVQISRAEGNPFDDPLCAPSMDKSHAYVFRCATTGEVEVQVLSRQRLRQFRKEEECIGENGLLMENASVLGFKGCPKHPWESGGKKHIKTGITAVDDT
ncbi:uncharacterized protein F4822DRAFT_263329 [Hypoxylon trugodes]|uniref:uncharacterized protein n=1 Tax=Hypoxylon trugodes TaxID=326681 RepID=UPI00219CB080|nr:uncharacterized protein F4822DRAFT_263329 [Hypoxylon trugodes]KAI1388953.1 hypothetical protein F4822DRAFT_263329 [Hypoxylon trugodes]